MARQAKKPGRSVLEKRRDKAAKSEARVDAARRNDRLTSTS